ncbi:MAG: hypothetical protein ACR2IE_15565 [Candidatus Sumerlaeaceae bacterium]
MRSCGCLLRTRRQWLAIACAALAIAVTYPLQVGRAWKSGIFPPPTHLNIDSHEWTDIINTVPFMSETLPMHLSRPLYPGPAYFVKQIIGLSADALVLLRITNMVWLLVCVVTLHCWTLHWTGSALSGLVAVVFFCLSPCVQIYLSQPVPTVIGNAAALVPLLLVVWAASTQRTPHVPAAAKWVLAGGLSAILMLGKEVYAIYVCLALAALWRRAWKPLMYFSLAVAAVNLAWFAYVHFEIGRAYRPYGENQQGFLSWIWNDFARRGFAQQMIFLPRLLARMAVRSIQAFELWPVVLAGLGFYMLKRRPVLELFSYAVAFLVMFFAINVVTPRICFLMYPAIYPLAAYGAVVIGQRTLARSRALGVAWIMLLALLTVAGALVDPYAFYYYG